MFDQPGTPRRLCPTCGNEIEYDPDGAWCETCQEYWTIEDLRDYDEELYDDDKA